LKVHGSIDRRFVHNIDRRNSGGNLLCPGTRRWAIVACANRPGCNAGAKRFSILLEANCILGASEGDEQNKKQGGPKNRISAHEFESQEHNLSRYLGQVYKPLAMLREKPGKKPRSAPLNTLDPRQNRVVGKKAFCIQ